MSEPTIRYKVENWPEYNQSLIRRGDITLWFDQEVIDQWKATERTGKRGRPKVYSAVVIHCMSTLRLLYSLPFRSAQGLFCSLLCLLGLALPVPYYTTLCRRQATLPVNLAVSTAEEPRHILIDSTGLKVFGEGEWKVRQHGVGKRRTWRKLHLAIDAKSREIVAAVLTDSGTADSEVLPTLLLQIDGEMAKISADGAYDSWECRYSIIQHHSQAVIPQRKNAVINGNDQIQEVRQRDEALEQIKAEGLKAWKQASGYHQRSLAETTMFRVKTTFGTEMKARVIQNQITEALLKSHILNRFIQQGLPASVKVEG
jgi:IS5 family transposase